MRISAGRASRRSGHPGRQRRHVRQRIYLRPALLWRSASGNRGAPPRARLCPARQPGTIGIRGRPIQPEGSSARPRDAEVRLRPARRRRAQLVPRRRLSRLSQDPPAARQILPAGRSGRKTGGGVRGRCQKRARRGLGQSAKPDSAHAQKINPKRANHAHMFGSADRHDRRFLRRPYFFDDGLDAGGDEVRGLHHMSFVRAGSPTNMNGRC